jgi:hypothetical protein
MVLVYAIGAQPVRRAERMHFEEAKNRREKTAGKPGPSFDD